MVKKTFKRISALAMAAVVSFGALCGTASGYIADKSWHVYSVNGAPSGTPGLEPSVTRDLNYYSGGYMTYCSTIQGGNDRRVMVTANGMTDYNITSTGYSSVKYPEPIDDEKLVVFHFIGRSETSCQASGTVGFNINP